MWVKYKNNERTVVGFRFLSDTSPTSYYLSQFTHRTCTRNKKLINLLEFGNAHALFSGDYEAFRLSTNTKTTLQVYGVPSVHSTALSPVVFIFTFGGFNFTHMVVLSLRMGVLPLGFS